MQIFNTYKQNDNELNLFNTNKVSITLVITLAMQTSFRFYNTQCH